MPPGSKSKKKKSKSKSSKKHTHVDKHPIEAEIIDEEDDDEYPTSRVIKRAPNGDVIVESLPENGKNSNKKSKKKSKANAGESGDLDSSKEIGLTLDSHWESLSPEEKKSILRIEKEEVLEVIRSYQNDHNCSCSVCGRRHMAMNQEMERIYNLLYELEEQRDSETNPIKFHLGIIKELQISKNQQLANQPIENELNGDNSDQVVKNFLASDVADKLKAEVQQFKQKQISKQETIKKTANKELPHDSTHLPNDENEIRGNSTVNEVQRQLEQLSKVTDNDNDVEVTLEGEDNPDLAQIKNEYMRFTESYISSHPKLAQKFVDKIIQFPAMRELTDELMKNSSYELLDALKNLWFPNRLKIMEPNSESGFMNINKTLDPKEFTTMLHNGNPLSVQDYRDLQGAISRKVVNAYDYQKKSFENLSALEVELFGRFMCKDEDNFFHDLILTAFNEKLKDTTYSALQKTPEQMLAVAAPTTLDDSFQFENNSEDIYTSDYYDEDDEEDSEYYDIKDEEYESEFDDLNKENILSDFGDHQLTDSQPGESNGYNNNTLTQQNRIPKDEEVILESANGKIQSLDKTHLDIANDYTDHNHDLHHNHDLVTDDIEHDESIDDEYESSIDDMERLEEGRKLIQIAITKLLQGRILESYHEKEADNNRLKLLRELEEEQEKKKEREEKKLKKKEKEKEKRKQQQLAKEEEKRKKIEEEKRAKEEQERKEMERREAQRKKVEEAKRKKDEERRRKLEEQRKREEQQEKQRKLKEEQKRKREEEKRKKEEEERRKEEEKKRKEEEEERLKKEEEQRLKEEENKRKIEELVLNSNKTPSPFDPTFNTVTQSPFNTGLSVPTSDTDGKSSGRKNSHLLGLTQVYSDNIATSPNQTSSSNEISNEIFNIINAATSSAKSLSRSPPSMQSLLEPAKNIPASSRTPNNNNVTGSMPPTGTSFSSNETPNIHRNFDDISTFGATNGLANSNSNTNAGLNSWNSFGSINTNLNSSTQIPMSSETPTQPPQQISPIYNNGSTMQRDYLSDELNKLTSMLSSGNMHGAGYNPGNSGVFQSSLWHDQMATNTHNLSTTGIHQTQQDPRFFAGADQVTHRSSIWDDVGNNQFGLSHRASEHSIPSLNTQPVQNEQTAMDSAFINPSIWSSNNGFDLNTRDNKNTSTYSNNSFGNMAQGNVAMNSNVNYNLQEQQRKELSDNIKHLSSNGNGNGYIPINSLYSSMANKNEVNTFLNNLMDLQEPLGYEVVKDQTGMVNGLKMNSNYQGLVTQQFNSIPSSIDNLNGRSLSQQNIQLGAAHIPNLDEQSSSANNIAMNIMFSTSPSRP